MAQNRMTYQALLDQLQGADTDVLRRVLEQAMQLPRAWGIRWSLLGSVNQQCVEHAPCPVVVVPRPTATASKAT